MAIPVTDRITRGFSGVSEFAIGWESDLKLSYVTVNSISDRDAIPEWKRLPYMSCNVVADPDSGNNKEYILGSNVTIAGQVWTAKDYGVPSNVVTEDEIFDGEGYILPSLIRNIFLNDSFVVASEAEMLALTTLTGNFVIRTDTGEVYIKLNDDNPADISDFATSSAPAAVLSVNGLTGVVNLTTTNFLAFGSNQTLFDTAVTNSPTVVDHTATIADLTTDLDTLTTYVDNFIASNPVTATLISPTSGEDGYAIRWNETEGKWDLLPISGGSSSYTFGNGLTETVPGVVRLGGTLSSANVEFTGDASYQFIYNFATLGANSGITINNTSTDASGGTQKTLEIVMTGANVSTETTYGLYINNAKTNGTSYGLYSEATIAGRFIGAISQTSTGSWSTFNNTTGNNITPSVFFLNSDDDLRFQSKFVNDSNGVSSRSAVGFQNSSSVGLTLSYTGASFSGSIIGSTVGINTGLIYNQQNAPIIFGTNDVARFTIGAAGGLGIGVSFDEGTLGQVLTSGGAGTLPSWVTPAGGISGLTTNRIPYATSSTTLGDDSALTWDATNDCITIGTARLFNRGNQNLFIGQDSGNFTLTGASNVGVGYLALNANTTGFQNVGIGRQALGANTTGDHNTAVGAYALYQLNGGQGNTGIGNGALGAVTLGNDNIGIGDGAGDNISTGSSNIAIGNLVDIQSPSASNQLSIQNIIFGSGNSGIGTTISSGNIGIGINSWGTSAARVLSIGNGTAPTTEIANGIQIFSVDSGDATATLGLYLEQDVISDVAIASTHSIKLNINGTDYKILLATP